ISLIGGAAFVLPSAVLAQVSPGRPRIAVLGAGSAGAVVSGFSPGLEEIRYVEGRDIELFFRYAGRGQEGLSPPAGGLVRLKPDVIVTGSTDATLAVKQATAAIPIVSTALTDPVAFGLVETQARPGRQVTGILTTLESLPGKQLELALEVVPGATRIGML